MLRRLPSERNDPLSEMHIFKVEGMGCQGCVTAVEKAIRSAAPDAAVEIGLSDGIVRVGNSGASREILAAAIAKAGYDVVPG
jgi:copper chaperone